jgi:hypothetical protein
MSWTASMTLVFATKLLGPLLVPGNWARQRAGAAMARRWKILHSAPPCKPRGLAASAHGAYRAVSVGLSLW